MSHQANDPIGSQGGNTTGTCFNTSSTSADTNFLSTTTSNTYLLNQSSVISKYPSFPLSLSQEFSTHHFVYTPSCVCNDVNY